jgi:hypothetical protein
MPRSSRVPRREPLNLSQATALLEANAGVYRYGARGQFHVATQGSNDPSEDNFDSTSDKLHKDRTASNPALLEQRTGVIGQEDWPMWGIYDGHEYVDRNPLSASTRNLTFVSLIKRLCHIRPPPTETHTCRSVRVSGS